MSRIVVRLDAQDIAYCDDIARRRQECAERHNRRGGNGGPVTGPTALRISILGVRGEFAAYCWLKPLGLKWQDYTDAKNIADLPDIGGFIDVKTVDRPGMNLIVQPKARDDWAYLMVNGQHHPSYALEGWRWGWDAKRDEFFRDPVGGRGAYFVPIRELRHPDELWQVIVSEA